MYTARSTDSNDDGNLWYTTEYALSELEGLQATCAQCTSKNYASIYVRWGHRSCPSHARQLSTGFAAGSEYGGGANTLCITATGGQRLTEETGLGPTLSGIHYFGI